LTSKNWGNYVLEEVPEDVLQDIREYEETYFATRKKRRKMPLPTNKDIAAAIRRVVRQYYGRPEDFPDSVREYLESRGFYVGLIRDERMIYN